MTIAIIIVVIVVGSIWIVSVNITVFHHVL